MRTPLIEALPSPLLRCLSRPRGAALCLAPGRSGGAAALGALGALEEPWMRCCGILLGSRNLRNYDPTLLPYTFGAMCSAFAIAYRYTVWLQRPPTRVYWRRVEMI